MKDLCQCSRRAVGRGTCKGYSIVSDCEDFLTSLITGHQKSNHDGQKWEGRRQTSPHEPLAVLKGKDLPVGWRGEGKGLTCLSFKWNERRNSSHLQVASGLYSVLCSSFVCFQTLCRAGGKRVKAAGWNVLIFMSWLEDGMKTNECKISPSKAGVWYSD